MEMLKDANHALPLAGAEKAAVLYRMERNLREESREIWNRSIDLSVQVRELESKLSAARLAQAKAETSALYWKWAACALAVLLVVITVGACQIIWWK